jgi:Leucine-rich repeat (LRR) protein
MNITVLNLGHNAFRRLPTAALRKLADVTTLVLDGALAPILETGALTRVRVKFLSLAACPQLTHLEAGSLDDLPLLETLTLNSNPALAYVHPGSLARVPSLIALDLTNNNLSALEDLQPYTPSLRSLYLAGNVLRCHCGLRWLQSNLGAAGGAGSSAVGGGFVVQDGDHVRCRKPQRSSSPSSSLSPTPLSSADLSDCGPFILPLFPAESEADMGHNISWACRPVGGAGANTVSWRLPNGTALAEMPAPGGCGGGGERACVRPGGELFLAYLHPADEGLYTCRAANGHGEDVRSVRLHVKVKSVKNLFIYETEMFNN